MWKDRLLPLNVLTDHTENVESESQHFGATPRSFVKNWLKASLST